MNDEPQASPTQEAIVLNGHDASRVSISLRRNNPTVIGLEQDQSVQTNNEQLVEVEVDSEPSIPKLENYPPKSRHIIESKILEITSDAKSLINIKAVVSDQQVPKQLDGNSQLEEAELITSEQLKEELNALEQLHARLSSGIISEDTTIGKQPLKRALEMGRKILNKKGYTQDRKIKLQTEINTFNQRVDVLIAEVKKFLPSDYEKAKLVGFSDQSSEFDDEKIIEIVKHNHSQVTDLAQRSNHFIAKEKTLNSAFSQTKLTKLDTSDSSNQIRPTVEVSGEYRRHSEYPAYAVDQAYNTTYQRMVFISRQLLEARIGNSLQLRESANSLFRSVGDRHGETSHAHVCQELVAACHSLNIAIGSSAEGGKGLMSDQHLEWIVKDQDKINKEMGTSTDIMYHNGSMDTLLSILHAGGIKSHAQLLGEGKSFTFRSGGGYTVSPEGITHNHRLISWKEYNEDKFSVKANKDPLMEHHQVLLSYEGPYYRMESWTLAIPERSLLDYQISGNQDGYHLFDPNFDEKVDRPLADGNVGTVHGANIDFTRTPFIVAIKAEVIDSVLPLIKESLGLNDEDFKEWQIKHLLVVDEIDTRETNRKIKEQFFTKELFQIPERSGVFIPTGNTGETASGARAHLYQYVSR